MSKKRQKYNIYSYELKKILVVFAFTYAIFISIIPLRTV